MILVIPVVLACVLVLALAPLFARRVCRRLGLVKPNFRGAHIPAAVGLTFLFVTGALYAALSVGIVPLAAVVNLAPVFLFVALVFGLLGLIDDVWGSRAVGGFKGHIRSLLAGRPTTGALKLVGGGLAALAGAWWARGGDWLPLVVDAGVIALAANTLNLLDLRPGRALFGFALLAVPTLVFIVCVGGSAAEAALLLGPAMLAAAVEWLPDTRGRAMMGDTGSNLLGAVAGLAATVVLPFGGRVVLFVLLFAINALAERVSLSRLIDDTPFLRALDRRLGVR